MSLLPVAVYGLEVPCGDVMIPAVPDFPATFRITMAAIDPSAPAELDGATDADTPARATLKLIRQPPGMDDDDDSEGESDEEDYLNALLDGADSEDEDDEDDEDELSDDEEEVNGGPSDPAKSKKARKDAAVEQLKQALANEESMELDGPNGVNGISPKGNKGKAKATGDEEDSDEDDDDEDLELEEFVICTLDTGKNYQQPLDLTIAEGERVYFKVSGTHTIYLTGNYVVPSNEAQGSGMYDGEEEDEDYDLSPDEDELDDDEESDDLDALEDPRITEMMSDEDEPPKLIKQDKKGKNKRAAENSDDEPANLDDIIAKSLKPAEATSNGEVKLSKKQLKKLKNNAGEAVAAAVVKNAKKEDKQAKDSPNAKPDKKVQFAKKLEQGPSSSSPATKPEAKNEAKSEAKNEAKKDKDQPKASPGVKTVQGVIIDDKKPGKGPAAKKGDKISMRYIGKLQDGKVFDANKKGKPFTFKLGSGEVIKGWDIGVAGMSVGGERRFTVPANLAYGNKAQPGIPANSTLVFDVKVLEIK